MTPVLVFCKLRYTIAKDDTCSGLIRLCILFVAAAHHSPTVMGDGSNTTKPITMPIITPKPIARLSIEVKKKELKEPPQGLTCSGGRSHVKHINNSVNGARALKRPYLGMHKKPHF